MKLGKPNIYPYMSDELVRFKMSDGASIAPTVKLAVGAGYAFHELLPLEV